MVKIRLKNLKKSVEDCYAEYIEYCIAIGQREKTIDSKRRFYRYELPKVVDVSENIETLEKDRIESHIILMRRQEYKGNTYQTFVIKLRTFLTFCFMNNYLTKFNIKIPTVDLEKKVVYTEDELNKLLKKPNLNSCLVGEYKGWVTINFLLGTWM